ncbi:MAG: DUF3592 domain-containing protein [Isosphaeraceae bacterium]|nr:DUF3592 domain-containing protein [Isosphaeraceae bacterium]
MSWSHSNELGSQRLITRSSFPPILLFLGGLFALIGLGLLVGASWSYDSTRRFAAGAATATGTVTEMVRREGREPGDSPTYAPRIRFRTARGRTVEFIGTPISNRPAYSVGDEVRVLYDPARPERASVAGFLALWGIALILGGIGALFTAVGGSLLALHLRIRLGEAARVRQREALEDLRQFGRRVDAKFREVRSDFGETYRIIAQWHDPAANKVYVFESDPLGYDPSEFITGTVPVYIDPDDPRRYLVDTTSLPSLGNATDPE